MYISRGEFEWASEQGDDGLGGAGLPHPGHRLHSGLHQHWDHAALAGELLHRNKAQARHPRGRQEEAQVAERENWNCVRIISPFISAIKEESFRFGSQPDNSPWPGTVRSWVCSSFPQSGTVIFDCLPEVRHECYVVLLCRLKETPKQILEIRSRYT